MTKLQSDLCRYIMRGKTLREITAHFGYNLDEIQDILGADGIECADYLPTSESVITVSSKTADEYEARKFLRTDALITRVIAIIALLISAVALLSQLGILQLR